MASMRRKSLNELLICSECEMLIWFACRPDVRRTLACAMKCVTARPGKLLATSNKRTSRIGSFNDTADVCRSNAQSAAYHSRIVWSL